MNVRPRSPFDRAGWYGFAIVAVLLVLVPAACHFTQAQQAPDATRADGPAAEADVSCLNGWCIVKQDTLRSLLEGLQKLSAHTTELRRLCGWERKP